MRLIDRQTTKFITLVATRKFLGPRSRQRDNLQYSSKLPSWTNILSWRLIYNYEVFQKFRNEYGLTADEASQNQRPPQQWQRHLRAHPLLVSEDSQEKN
jgi:hypothetical protein